MNAPTLTQQAEAILARAKAIDAYTATQLGHEYIRAERCEEAVALRYLCIDLSNDADDQTVDDWAPNSDLPYEMMISDLLHAEAEA